MTDYKKNKYIEGYGANKDRTVQFDSDILNGLNFCDEGTFNRLTSTQQTCLSYSLPPGILVVNEELSINIRSTSTFDLTITLDGDPDGTYNAGTHTWELISVRPPADVLNSDDSYNVEIASGGTLILPDITVTLNATDITYPSVQDISISILNNESDTIGTLTGSDFIITDSILTINGTENISIAAEQPFDLSIMIGGVQSGTYDAGTNTWKITSYTGLVDDTNNPIYYMGWGDDTIAETDPFWYITRMSISILGISTTTTAIGAWSNRTSLIYT